MQAQGSPAYCNSSTCQLQPSDACMHATHSFLTCNVPACPALPCPVQGPKPPAAQQQPAVAAEIIANEEFVRYQQRELEELRAKFGLNREAAAEVGDTCLGACALRPGCPSNKLCEFGIKIYGGCAALHCSACQGHLEVERRLIRVTHKQCCVHQPCSCHVLWDGHLAG